VERSGRLRPLPTTWTASDRKLTKKPAGAVAESDEASSPMTDFAMCWLGLTPFSVKSCPTRNVRSWNDRLAVCWIRRRQLALAEK
jgi:hypothetical protein